MLLIDPDARVLQAWLAGQIEIRGKRLPHKRAALVEGTVVELFIAQANGATAFVNFWDRYRWPIPGHQATVTADGIHLVSRTVLGRYRADWAQIRSHDPQCLPS